MSELSESKDRSDGYKAMWKAAENESTMLRARLAAVEVEREALRAIVERTANMLDGTDSPLGTDARAALAWVGR